MLLFVKGFGEKKTLFCTNSNIVAVVVVMYSSNFGSIRFSYTVILNNSLDGDSNRDSHDLLLPSITFSATLKTFANRKEIVAKGKIEKPSVTCLLECFLKLFVYIETAVVRSKRK